MALTFPRCSVLDFLCDIEVDVILALRIERLTFNDAGVRISSMTYGGQVLNF